MSDLFKEVDEDLRRDRAIELWKRYGGYVLAAAIAVVLGTGGYVAWRDYNRDQAEKHGMRFFAVAAQAAQGESAAAAAAFGAFASEAPSGYAALARLREAALKAQAGDAAAAATIYRGLADDSGVPQELRNVAALLAALHAVERLDPAELERRLAALRDGANPWRHSALEVAALAAMRAGEAGRARELYARIADDATAPAGLRARAAEMLAVLGT